MRSMVEGRDRREARGSSAERLPQQDLGKRQIASELTGGAHRPAGCRERGGRPSTTLRAVSLPLPGRIVRLASHHIRNTPNRARSAIGAFSVAASASPSTSRVWTGSMMPSSHSRAVA